MLFVVAAVGHSLYLTNRWELSLAPVQKQHGHLPLHIPICNPSLRSVISSLVFGTSGLEPVCGRETEKEAQLTLWVLFFVFKPLFLPKQEITFVNIFSKAHIFHQSVRIQ